MTTKPARDYLGWFALVAALISTAHAEHSLAVALGSGPWIALTVPAALDVYAVRALRTHRDVGAAMVAMVAVNAASHLYGHELSAVDTPLIIAVSSIAPLVVWRVHSIRPVATVPETPQVAAVAPQEIPAESTEHEQQEALYAPAEPFLDPPPTVRTPADVTATAGQSPDKAIARPPDMATLVAAYASLSAGGRTVTGQMMASHFGVSGRTGRRYLGMATA